MRTDIDFRFDFIPSDAEIEGLFEDLPRENRPPQTSKIFSKAETIITCYSGSRLIGVAYGSSSGASVNLDWLYVHTDFRRNGIGKKLVTQFLKRFSGCAKVKLVANPEAVPFYKKLGFKIRKEAIPMIADMKSLHSEPIAPSIRSII